VDNSRASRRHLVWLAGKVVVGLSPSLSLSSCLGRVRPPRLPGVTSPARMPFAAAGGRWPRSGGAPAGSGVCAAAGVRLCMEGQRSALGGGCSRRRHPGGGYGWRRL
jgi:hypothetical protein